MKTLLLVDPDPIIRRLLRILFADQYRVLEAGDGESALGLIYLGRPDLIILEVQLPDLCGVELCRALKGDPEKSLTPVIFLTATTDPAKRARALRHGAAGYLTKPFSPMALLGHVQELLDQNGSGARRETG